jgi:hypothetical protein
MKKKQGKAKKLNYPVKEFLQHFGALPAVRKYGHISRRFDGSADANQVEIGDSSSFEANALRVMDYFSQVYSDSDEAREKGILFLVILSHLAKYKEAYDSERFAVFTDSDQASNGA